MQPGGSLRHTSGFLLFCLFSGGVALMWELKHRYRFKKRVRLQGKSSGELQQILADFDELHSGRAPHVERFQEKHPVFASLNRLWLLNSYGYWTGHCRRALLRQGLKITGNNAGKRFEDLRADIKENLRSRGLLYTFDSLLGGFFGAFLEVRCLEFCLSWGRATRKKVIGAPLKRLFVWFCSYFTGVVVSAGGSFERPVVMPYGDIFDLVKRARVATCNPCSCKSLLLPDDPEMPRDSCMGFQFIEDMADLHSPGYREEYILPEAVAAKLKQCEEYGMVHQIMTVSRPTGQKGYVLCNCARGSCVPLDLYVEYGIPMLKGSGSVVRTEEIHKCISCGKCLERCVFQAVEIIDGQPPLLHKNKCLGCGLCVTTCPASIRSISAA